MDRATDAVYLADTSFDERKQWLIQTARIKGLKVVPRSMDGPARDTTIVYRGVQVHGWWPCIEYLLDTRPYPNLLPSSVQERAIVRCSVDLVLSDPMYIGQFHQLYARRTYETSEVELPNGTPLLLDIAIASYRGTPIAETFPWIEQLAIAVEREAIDMPIHSTEEVEAIA